MGDLLEVHLTGEDTGGTHCLIVDHPAPGFELVAHLHRHEDETIHVLEGTFAFAMDGVERRLGPGDTAFVPRGTIHAIRNCGTTTGRRLIVFHPAGLEHFFLEAGSDSPDARPDPEALLAAARRHGWELVA